MPRWIETIMTYTAEVKRLDQAATSGAATLAQAVDVLAEHVAAEDCICEEDPLEDADVCPRCQTLRWVSALLEGVPA